MKGSYYQDVQKELLSQENPLLYAIEQRDLNKVKMAVKVLGLKDQVPTIDYLKVLELKLPSTEEEQAMYKIYSKADQKILNYLLKNGREVNKSDLSRITGDNYDNFKHLAEILIKNAGDTVIKQCSSGESSLIRDFVNTGDLFIVKLLNEQGYKFSHELVEAPLDIETIEYTELLKYIIEECGFRYWSDTKLLINLMRYVTTPEGGGGDCSAEFLSSLRLLLDNGLNPNGQEGGYCAAIPAFLRYAEADRIKNIKILKELLVYGATVTDDQKEKIYTFANKVGVSDAEIDGMIEKGMEFKKAVEESELALERGAEEFDINEFIDHNHNIEDTVAIDLVGHDLDCGL